MATDQVTAVPSPVDNGNDAAMPAGGRRRWGFLVVCLVGVVLLSASTAVAVGAHAQQHRTDAALASVRARLSQMDTLLIEARAQLAVDTAQSNQAGHTLSTESAQLAADQAQLAQAQAGVYAQGVSISDLDTWRLLLPAHREVGQTIETHLPVRRGGVAQPAVAGQ